MESVHKWNFGDISPDVMAEIAEGLADDHAFDLAQCESRNHKEHRGELWQCGECLRVFCSEEEPADDHVYKCEDCCARLHASRLSVSIA